MERVIYYLMLLFGFLIMQRVYKWRVENGLNKSKELGNEDKEDKGRKEAVKDVSLLVGFGGLRYVNHFAEDLFLLTESSSDQYKMPFIHFTTDRAFFVRDKPFYFRKKVSSFEALGLNRSLDDYNNDLFNIVSGNFDYRRFYLDDYYMKGRFAHPKDKIVRSVLFFSDPVSPRYNNKNMSSDLYDYNDGRGFVYLTYDYNNGLRIHFNQGLAGGGDFEVINLNELLLDYSLETNEVYFFGFGLYKDAWYGPKRYVALATHSNDDTLNLFKFFDFFVRKLKEAK